jgi:hypothetical protein
VPNFQGVLQKLVGVIIAGMSPIVSTDEVMALIFGTGGQVVFPKIRKEVTSTGLIKPRVEPHDPPNTSQRSIFRYSCNYW